jgi:hypothetical protein
MRDMREVLAEERVLPLLAERDERRGEPAAGVVHQDVERPEVVAHPREETPDVFALPHVEAVADAAPSARHDPVDGRRELLGIAVAHGDVRPEARQRQRDRAADAHRRAGHHRDAVGQ